MNFKKLASALLVSLLLASAAVPAISALTPHGTGILLRNWLKNDPDYQFSEAYMTSVWYENFSSLELTENDRNNILRIAVSQLGYHEGDSPEDFDGRNTEGSENYIEYGRLLVPNWNNNSYDWCACFVNWCLNQAGFDKASSELSCRNWVSELTSMNMYKKSKAHGGNYTPQPADFIFFNWDGRSSPANHIGFVLYTTETHVYTIEGNSKNDNVAIRSYALNDSRVIGYGTPPYYEGNEPTVNYGYTDGMPCGVYVVEGYDVVLMSDPDGDSEICSIPGGSSVILHEVVSDMAFVTYGDSEGYVPANILWFLSRDITLSFDANGGQNAPASAKVNMGAPYDPSATLPTLEGDTFLGWSTTSYNAIPDFKVGDPVSAGWDTTLYAVWEKRSATLANEAFAAGKAPRYDRPDTIENSAALLVGTVTDPSLLTVENAQIAITTDSVLGNVLTLTAIDSESASSVTLDYAALTSSLLLAPVNGNTVRYAVLKVQNLPITDTSLKLSLNGSIGKSASLAVTGSWRYVVMDLTQNGLEGDLTTLRLDWQEGNRPLCLANIFFVSTEEQVNALLTGAYIFPAQERSRSEPEIETETERETETEIITETEVETTGSEPETTVSAPTVTEESSALTEPVVTSAETNPDLPLESECVPEDTTESSHSGCGSSLVVTSLFSLVTGAIALVTLRKKED